MAKGPPQPNPKMKALHYSSKKKTKVDISVKFDINISTCPLIIQVIEYLVVSRLRLSVVFPIVTCHSYLYVSFQFHHIQGIYSLVKTFR